MWYLPPFNFFLKPKRKTMKGIDVSHHQGAINWSKVATDPMPVEFAIIKATEGTTFTDPMLFINAEAAKKAGLKVSYYHFASLNTEDVLTDAKAEAQFFAKRLAQVPPPDLPLVLDIESNKANLKPERVSNWIVAFFAELENLGYIDYVLYSYTPFLNANLPKNHGLGWIRLWIAAYVNKPQPVLPVGWKSYWLWQYSAKGSVTGIKGDVDMNKV